MSDSPQQKNVAKIEPNMSGVFITCVKNKEALCVRECYDLFNEYAGKFFLSQAINTTDSANKSVGNDNDDNLDIEDVIAKELSEMKKPHSSNSFASIQTGTDYKKELINMIAKIVGEDHTVNLNNPELTIIVEIFKVFEEHIGNNNKIKE
ncbi:12211_t:CDS:2 [Entrophospora sp. SA101]|nr:12211_t:CDS:2 [Entrophospora sp. SA101]